MVTVTYLASDLLLALSTWRVIIWVSYLSDCIISCSHFPIESGALDSDSEADTDEEDAYHLGEISSDVEMHPDDLDGLDSDGQ